jgi:hypothetical protein
MRCKLISSRVYQFSGFLFKKSTISQETKENLTNEPLNAGFEVLKKLAKTGNGC